MDFTTTDFNTTLDIISYQHYRTMAKDLRSLKEVLTKHVPDIFWERTDETDIPFPVRLVSGITEEDIDCLQKVFGLDGSIYSRYGVWGVFYCDANEEFTKKKEEAGLIRKEIDRLAQNNVPSAPLLLMLAKGWWAEKQFKPWLIKTKRTLREADLQFDELRKKLIRDTEKFARSVEKFRQGLRGNYVDEWAKTYNLEKMLADLKKAIAEEQDSWGQMIRFNSNMFMTPDLPETLSMNDSTTTLIDAFGGIARLISERWRKWGAHQEAEKLFGLWDITITPETLRKTKARAPRKKDPEVVKKQQEEWWAEFRPMIESGDWEPDFEKAKQAILQKRDKLKPKK